MLATCPAPLEWSFQYHCNIAQCHPFDHCGVRPDVEVGGDTEGRAPWECIEQEAAHSPLGVVVLTVWVG